MSKATIVGAFSCIALLIGPSSVAASSGGEALSLGEALERARADHPDLRAAELRIEAAGARARQKALPPNPSLGIDVENVIGSGDYGDADLAETTVYLTQPLELFGKRGKRGRAADLERVIAESEAAMLRAELDEQVTAAFAGVLAAQERTALARGWVELTLQLCRGLEQRVERGTSQESELDRARDALAAGEIELDSEEALLSSARAELAIASGIELASLPPLVGDLERVEPPPDLEPLLSWRGDRTVARLWQAKIDSHRAAVSYQQALRVPDLSVSAGYRRFSDTDDQAAVFYLSVPLPVFDRNRGGVDAASLELEQAKALRRSAELRWQAQVLDVHRQLVATHRILEVSRGEATDAYDALHAVFEDLDSFDFNDFARVDEHRTQLRLRRDYIDALERYHRSWARLQRLTASAGTP